MQTCSVIVGNGSGVLIQPMSDSYSYILTAKHVVTDRSGVELPISQLHVEQYNGAVIGIRACLIDPAHDIAILKTINVILTELERCIDDVKAGEELYLLGYPNTRRTKCNEERLRDFKGKATVRVLDKVFSIALDSQPGHDQLEGISGCGVFREIEGRICLCGVEFRVEGGPNREYHGQAECMPLGVFDALITSNSENYAPILPSYLLCFSRVKEHTFGFNGVGTPESVTYLKSVLHNTIHSHVTKKSLPIPLELYNKYKDCLLIYQSPSEDALNIRCSGLIKTDTPIG
jgi:hypothetical protein